MARGDAKLIWEQLTAALLCLPPSAVHWSMANKFIRREYCFIKGHSVLLWNPITPLITSLREKALSPPYQSKRPDGEVDA